MRLLIVCLGTMVSLGASAQTSWYFSDALGTQGEPAPQGSGSGWVLRIEPRAQGEDRILFHHGKEDSERRIDFDSAGRVLKTEDFRGGAATWEVSYDPETGLPTEETSFEGGRPAETAKLVFDHRVLARRAVYSDPKTLLYTDTLSQWPDGTLRRLERDGPAGPLAEVEWSYGSGGRLTGSWLVEEENKALGQHREISYKPGKTVETLATGIKILLTRVTEELQSGSISTQTDVGLTRVEKRTLDDQGRPQDEVVTVKDQVVQSRHWTYDSKGRLTEVATESAGPREVWTYAYGEDGAVTNRLTRGGTLVREEFLVDGVKTSVRLYDRGTLFLVETWTGGRLTKETFYQNGAVVRERTP